MRYSAPVLAAVVALLAGCGGQHSLAPGRLSQVVLQPSDLHGWTRFQDDPGTAADAGQLGSRDRTGDWIARYRRGAAVVVSRVDIYRNAAAAHDVFGNLRGQAGPNGVRPLAVPVLGDERLGYRVGGLQPVAAVFWRRANAIGSIVVQGHGPAAAPLAQREDAKINGALR